MTSRVKEISLELPSIEIISPDGYVPIMSFQEKLTPELKEYLDDVKRIGYQVSTTHVVANVHRITVSKVKEVVGASFAVDGPRSKALLSMGFSAVDGRLVSVKDYFLGGQFGKARGRTVVLDGVEPIFLTNLDQERILKAENLTNITSNMAGEVVERTDMIPALRLSNEAGYEMFYFPGEFNALSTSDGVNLDEIDGIKIPFNKKPYFVGTPQLFSANFPNP